MNDHTAELILQKLSELVEVEKLKTAAIVRFVEKCELDEPVEAPEREHTGADALTVVVPRGEMGAV